MRATWPPGAHGPRRRPSTMPASTPTGSAPRVSSARSAAWRPAICARDHRRHGSRAAPRHRLLAPHRRRRGRALADVLADRGYVVEDAACQNLMADTRSPPSSDDLPRHQRVRPLAAPRASAMRDIWAGATATVPHRQAAMPPARRTRRPRFCCAATGQVAAGTAVRRGRMTDIAMMSAVELTLPDQSGARGVGPVGLLHGAGWAEAADQGCGASGAWSPWTRIERRRPTPLYRARGHRRCEAGYRYWSPR